MKSGSGCHVDGNRVIEGKADAVEMSYLKINLVADYSKSMQKAPDTDIVWLCMHSLTSVHLMKELWL